MNSKYFKINGVSIPSPDMDGFSFNNTIITQEEGTGRNQLGDMILTIIGVGSDISLKWSLLNEADFVKLSNLLDKVVFNFTFPVRGNTVRTESFYCNAYNVDMVTTTSGNLYTISTDLAPMKLRRVEI